MTNLGELLDGVAELDEDATIYARRPWSRDSEAVDVIEGEAPAASAIEAGLSYVLEVSVVRDVLETWSAWREGRSPDAEEKCAAVIYYATNDAYLAP